MGLVEAEVCDVLYKRYINNRVFHGEGLDYEL